MAQYKKALVAATVLLPTLLITGVIYAITQTRDTTSFSAERTAAPAGVGLVTTRAWGTVEIPSLQATIPIEAVGMGSDKKLAKPTNSEAIAWYAAGVLPGQPGNAVFAGAASVDGQPGVLKDISVLVPGVIITITRQDNKRISFEVIDSEVVPEVSFNFQAIAGQKSAQRFLKLLTYETYNAQTSTYDDRRIVTARLISE